MNFTTKEIATCLAALRYYQNNPEIGEDNEINTIATNCGEFKHMTADEINGLCEQLNFAKLPRVIVEIQGGVCVEVYSSEPLDVEVLDWDNVEDPESEQDARTLCAEAKKLKGQL